MFAQTSPVNEELREEKEVVWENLSSGNKRPQGSMKVDQRILRESEGLCSQFVVKKFNLSNFKR